MFTSTKELRPITFRLCQRATSSLPLCLLLLTIASQIGFSLSQDSSYLDSDFGDEIDFSYLDKSYSDKPQNVSLEPSSSTTVMVRWEPPYGEAPYGSLLGYKIKFKNKSSKKQETISIEPNRHFYELTNLEKGTSYMVKMWAFFSNGTGPVSEWITVETLQKDLDETQVPDKPSQLRARPDSTSIHLTWAPPKKKDILVKGYKIGWGIGVPDVYEQVIGGDQRSYTIPKLQASSEYVISLRAYNRLGDGQPTYETVKTSSESLQEAQTAMLPPVGLKATVVSSSSIMLDWTDTDSSAGQVHGHRSQSDNRWYLVRYTGNIHSNSPKYRYLNSSMTNCMVEDLKANTQYEFAVRVIKNKRNSTWSMSVLNSTQEAVPATAPRDLTVVASPEEDPSTVNLHWQPPKQPNGQITGYVIFYSTDNKQDDRDWAVKVIVGDKLNAVIPNVQPASSYFFKIQARNNKGYGPLSGEVSFKTLPAALKVQDPNANSVSISLFVLVVILIFIIGCFLLLALFKMYSSKTETDKNVKNRKGYLPAATSPCPGGKNTNSRLNNTRLDLKPPDLWIHHNEQVELKCIDKSGNGADSPVFTRQHEPHSFAKIKKTNSTYGVNSSLYDDINKPPTSPVDSMGGLATMRRSSTIRTKAATCLEHALSNGIINLEPSTGLSRPLYPKTQFNMPRAHMNMNMDSIDSAMAFNSGTLHLYDPVAAPPPMGMMSCSMAGPDPNLASIHIAMANSNNSYSMSGNSSSSPHSVVSNNTVLTNSSTATNITNSSTSPPNTSIYMSNKRPPGHSALKSFGVPTPPPPLPSLATLSSLQNGSQNNIYNTAMSGMGSPSKKFLLTTTNNLNSQMCGSNSTLASNGKATHFSDDHSISASFNEDLNQEMANLDSLMKDLNALKQNGLESC